tara:strand:- start:529 stop:705 length:177 start_codon:yes stop_codon:yes gene_type:complete
MDVWKNARNIELNKFEIDHMKDYIRDLEKRILDLHERLESVEKPKKAKKSKDEKIPSK